MKFLGTGGAEGIPNPFCSCKLCEYARKNGGHDIRTRSSFLIDEETVIDLGADYFVQSIIHKQPLCVLKYILFTHTHDDHFNYSLFWERSVRQKKESGEPINIYFSEDAYDIIEKLLMVSPLTDGREYFINNNTVRFHMLKFNQKYSIGEYAVTPLKGRHTTAIERFSANFLIEKEGKSLYYALDSGPFFEDTIKSLSGKKLDIFIGECTFASLEKINSKPVTNEHMQISTCLENLHILYQNDAITSNTCIYLTHFADGSASHDELCKYFSSLSLPYKINIAYDGMEINFPNIP